MYRAIDGYAIMVVLSSTAVHVCVLQLSISSSVIAKCLSVCCTLSLSWCVMLVVAANLEALLQRTSKCERVRVCHSVL